MSNFVPNLSWERSTNLEINSLDNLERMINTLEEEAKRTFPFSIEIQMNTNTALSITVGRMESHLEFYSSEDYYPVVSSLGPWDEEDLIEFSHEGDYSELERKFFVPIEDAREAVRLYYSSKKRPNNITWSYGGKPVD